MTWDGQYTTEMVMGFQNGTWVRDASGKPVKRGELVGDGLVKITKTDPWTERKCFEYQQVDPNAHKAWMDPFKAIPYVQVPAANGALFDTDGIDKRAIGGIMSWL